MMTHALDSNPTVAAFPDRGGSHVAEVFFGTRLFRFSIGADEIQHLLGHALELSKGAAALQHFVGLHPPADDDDLGNSEPRDIQAAITFVASMAAQLLAAAEGVPT